MIYQRTVSHLGRFDTSRQTPRIYGIYPDIDLGLRLGLGLGLGLGLALRLVLHETELGFGRIAARMGTVF